MIISEYALLVAELKLLELEKYVGETLALTEKRETNYGWCFFYQSDEYLRTNNISYALAGNAPFFVNNIDGSITEFGTAHPVEYYIEQYESSLVNK